MITPRHLTYRIYGHGAVCFTRFCNRIVSITIRLLLVGFLSLAAHAQTVPQRGFGKPDPAPAVGRRLVVAIGIDEYKNWPKLGNATNDAIGFERELREKLGFQEAAAPLLNQDATRQALQHLVDDVLRRQLKAEDDLVLFFAGHGTTQVDTVGEKEIETGFLVPVDARGPGQEEEWSDYVQVDHFLESIGRLPARHILVVLDACNSGFALGSAMQLSRGDIRYQKDLAGRLSRRVITSARRNQAASDSGPRQNHSLFTGALIEGIESGEADLDGDGVVTSSELGLYLQREVGAYSDSAQTPDFGSFYLDDRGEMILPLNTASAIETPRRISSRRTVALLGFANLSGRAEQSWVSTALSEMLTTEISAGDRIRTISGENVSRMKRDLVLPDSGQLSSDSLARVYGFLGSDIVVTGSYLESGKELRVDVHIQDALSGDTIASISSSGSEAGMLDLVTRLGKELREKCGVGAVTEIEAKALANERPSSAEALHLYSEGIVKLRSLNARSARELLEQAVAADPSFAAAHSALAQAWSELGYDEMAKKETKEAFAASKGLPRKDALQIEALYDSAVSENSKAADIYKALWIFFPDDFESGLSLAKTLGFAGKGEEANNVINNLRHSPKPLRDDPRIDLAAAEVAESLSDYKGEIAAAEQAIQKSQRFGQRLAQARSYQMECWAYENLADLQRAEEAGQRALKAFSSDNDGREVARILTCLGTVAEKRGDLKSAHEMYEQALSKATEIGAQVDIAGGLINLATVLQSQNDLPQAIEKYQKALTLAINIGDKSDLLVAENNLGTIFYTQGDFDEAEDMYNRSLMIARETGNQGGVIEAMANLANIDYLHGALGEARRQVDSAIAKAKELGMDSDAASSIATMGDIFLAQGNLIEAEQKYQESLTICTKAKLNDCVASVRLSLGSLALENNKGVRAKELALDALREFESEGDVDHQAAAHDLIAQVLMSEGKLSEAETEIARASALSAQDQSIVLSVDVSSARLLALQEKFGDATAKLQRADDRAKSMRVIGWQLQIKLRNAELQLLTGKTEEGRESLELLAKDASEKGYELISQKAEAALETTKNSSNTKKIKN